jgi:hypothetical protein
MSPRPRGGAAAVLAGLSGRLTERDFRIIDALARFGVMTTAQLAAIYFPSVYAAKLRLLTLTDLGLLAKFRPPVAGTMRYTLDWAGQALHALRTGARLPSRTEAEWEVQRRCFSPTRTHDEGAVEAVAALHLACRQRGDAQITEWLSEAEAAHEFQGLRPDAAFALETADGRRLTAWYEHDTGSETLERLAGKVDAYIRRRSPLLPYNRKVLIGCATDARVRALAATVTLTGDLIVAAGPHLVLPPSSRALPDTTGLLTEPHWQRLGPSSGPCSLLDLTSQRTRQ